MKSSFLSPTQIHQLRAQIMAYRLLARNQPVPQTIGLAAQGKRSDLPQPQPQQQPPSGPAEQQLYPPTNQTFQRPTAPAGPGGPGAMQPSIRPPGPGYPQQQPTQPSASMPGVQQAPSPNMGPPPPATPSAGLTASPVPGTIPTPRPSQPQVRWDCFVFPFPFRH